MNDVMTPEAVAAASSVLASAWQWIVGAVVGLPVAAVAISNRLTRLRAERRERIEIDASAQVVLDLRAECARLREHNTVLVAWFQEAQLQIISIARENQRLQGTIEDLQAKIASTLRLHGGDA